MFILNLTKNNLVYRAHGLILVLEPGVNMVNENEFKEVELKNHFGEYISILTDTVEPEPINEEPEQDIAPVEDDKKDDATTEEEKEPEAPVEEDVEKEPEAPAEEPKKQAKAKNNKKTNKK